MGWYKLIHPSVGILSAAGLDGGESVVNLPGDLIALDSSVEALPLEMPQGYDDSSGAAGEDLPDPT